MSMSENGSPIRRNKRPSPRKHPYERAFGGGAATATSEENGSFGLSSAMGARFPLKTAATSSSSNFTTVTIMGGKIRSPLKNIQGAPKPAQKAKGGISPVKKVAPVQPNVVRSPMKKIQPIGQSQSNQPKPQFPLFHQQVKQQKHAAINIYTEVEDDNDESMAPVVPPPPPAATTATITSAAQSKSTTAPTFASLFRTATQDEPDEVKVHVEEKDEGDETPSWNPFQSINIMQGVLGELQPRGLNSSFSEKFESRLGINSDPKVKALEEPAGINDENVAKGKNNNEPNLRIALGGLCRGVLTERLTPLFQCGEYVGNILRYWSRMEAKFRIKWDYMDRHEGISHVMRTILIDWIVEVVSEYDLTEESLHLTVNYIDRFLSKMNVKRTKLQLVGATAVFIAAKFEEMSPPEISDLVYVTDEAYTKDEILEMEKCMLTCLEFDLMMPTAHSFGVAYCSLLNLGDPGRSLVSYLVDLSLMEGNIFLKYVPSVVAGSAVALARFAFQGVFYDADLRRYCRHRKRTLIPCVRDLHEAFFMAPTKGQTSLYEKYQAVRYCSIGDAFIPNNGPWDEPTQ